MWLIILQIAVLVILITWLVMTGMFILGICFDSKINTNWIRPAFMVCYIILGLAGLTIIISLIGLLICFLI